MKPLIQLSARQREQGFTLVEVLASTALLILIMVLVLNTVDQTQKVWTRASAKVTQFQSARNAYESMTSRIGQATLNTYYRAFDENSTEEKSTLTYTRDSELQFMTGPAEKFFSGTPALAGLSPEPELAYPTHGIFFMAPLGFTRERDRSGPAGLRRFRSVTSALSAAGYFVEYDDDQIVPKFLDDASLVPERKRFRLMEMDVPTETLSVYQRPLDKTGGTKRRLRNDPQVLDAKKADYVGMVDKKFTETPNWVRPLWMQDALFRMPIPGSGKRYRFLNAHVLAENVVALIVLPKLGPGDRQTPKRIDELAPNFIYDSWRIIAEAANQRELAARYHLLPPIVQVVMVAVDEGSGQRIADHYKDKIPDWTANIFDRAYTEADFQNNIAQLEENLAKDPAKINYRIFSTDVVIRGSKWSRETNIAIIE